MISRSRAETPLRLKTSGDNRTKLDLRVAMPVPCMRAKLVRPGAGACSAWLFVSQHGV